MSAYGESAHRGSFAEILTQIGSLRAAKGDAAAAIDALEHAFAVTNDAFGDVLGFASERLRLAFLARQQRRLALFLSIVVRNPTPELVERAFEIVVGQKAMAADAAVAHRDEILSGRHPDLVDTLRELGVARTSLARLMIADAPASEAGAAAAATMLQDRREALERTLAARVPELAVTRRVRRASRASIVKGLPAGSTLVEIVQFAVDELTPSGTIDLAELIARRRGREAKLYVAFVVSADPARAIQLVELGDPEAIDELVERFRRWITRRPRRADAHASQSTGLLSESGSDLRAVIFEPLEDALGESRRLLVAPDGDLHRLPLEALPDGQGGCLIDRYSITYLSAARDVLRFGTEHHRQQSPAVVVADPDFDLRAPIDPSSGLPLIDAGEVEFQRLSGTRKEGRLVADLLVGAEELFGHRAVESAVKAVRAPRVLHLATHGWFLANRTVASEPEAANDPLFIDTMHVATIPGFETYLMDVASALNPTVEVPPHLRRLGGNQANPLLRSGLALAGANTWLNGGPLPIEAEDGLLTAEDVSALDLFGTDLVVLSACETGLGEVLNGEGVFGLRRAFILAGAATLVMSLWKVPDAATANLMADFYGLMQAGIERGEALRRAQLAMKSRSSYRDPYYWAVFVCQGDPGPLAITPSPLGATTTQAGLLS